MWQQDPPLPTEMTLDKDEQLLKKYNLLHQSPIPFPRSCTPENIALFHKWADKNGQTLIGTIGDVIFLIPELLFDEAVVGLRAINSEPSNSVNQTITSRVLSVDVVGSAHLFPEFMTFFEEREIRFFSGFESSYLYTPDVERGVADVNLNNFMIEQRKVMLDVVKKTYFSKYKFRAEEHIHDTAFYINEWHGIDFLTLPPMMGAYLYYRGLDKNFSIADTQLHVLIEPLQRFITHGDVIGGLALEWKPTKAFPFGIIASMGMYNRKPEFEFIGIGTSIGEVQKTIEASGGRLR